MSEMDQLLVSQLATNLKQANAIDQGKGLRQGEGMMAKEMKKQRIYSKEATAIIDISKVLNGGAQDIIRAIKEKVSVEKILAVRPKTNKQYEVTFETEEACDGLLNGLQIKGQICDVKKLQDREYVVSFMHLPVYLDDDDITSKLEGWGVTPITEKMRRFYPGMEIEDGTRFVKVKFPKEVASLPYSTRFETTEGSQYFRIIHSRQVKTCRLCLSPEHIIKDCPEFRCFKCNDQGHFSRDCTAIECPDCGKPLNICECWMEGNEKQSEEQQSMDRQVQDEIAETTETFEPMENKQQKQIEYMENQKLKDQSHQDGEVNRMEDDTEEGEDGETEQNGANDKEVNDEKESDEVEELDMEQQEARKEREKVGKMIRRKSMKVKPNLNVARKKKMIEIDKKKLGLIQEQDCERD